VALMAEPSLSDGAISCINSSVKGSPDNVDAAKANSIVEATKAPGAPAPVDQEVNKWYYIIPQVQRQ